MLKKPYKGDKNYIFISYAHKNMKEVHDFIETLQNHGYNVWYDEGIDPGTEWDDNIAKHIENCSFFIAFVTNDYVASQNCRDEMSFARDLDKERLLIYAEDVELPRGMQMRLNRLQAIYKYKYKDQSEFYDKVFEANAINTCKNDSEIEPTFTEATKQKDSVEKRNPSNNNKLIYIILGAVVCVALIVGIVLFTHSGSGAQNSDSEQQPSTTADTTENTDASGVIEVNKKNAKPTIYSDENANISIEELSYIKGASDLTIMLKVSNYSKELLYVSLDDVITLDDATVRPMFDYSFSDDNSFEPASGYSSYYYVDREDIENAGVEDFNDMTCVFRFRLGDKDLSEAKLHITRDAFTD